MNLSIKILIGIAITVVITIILYIYRLYNCKKDCPSSYHNYIIGDFIFDPLVGFVNSISPHSF